MGIFKDKNPLEVVKEIHGKVRNAAVTTLIAAEKTLARPEAKEYLEIENMARLGFDKSKEVVTGREKLKKYRTAFEQARLVDYYRMHYPQQNFVPTEEMDKILAQYGLLLGADKDFIGSIPQRCRQNIINFKLRPEDELFYKGTARIIKQGIQESDAVIEWAEITREEYNSKTNNGQNLVQKGRREHYISNKDYFMIAAPEIMFNMEGKIVEGNKIKSIIQVDDPAALKVVRAGYLCVELWGEELAIERLRLAGMN